MTIYYTEIAVIALLVASALFVIGYAAGARRSRLIVREAKHEAAVAIMQRDVAQSRIDMLERNERRLTRQRLAFTIHEDIIQIPPVHSVTVSSADGRKTWI